MLCLCSLGFSSAMAEDVAGLKYPSTNAEGRVELNVGMPEGSCKDYEPMTSFSLYTTLGYNIKPLFFLRRSLRNRVLVGIETGVVYDSRSTIIKSVDAVLQEYAIGLIPFVIKYTFVWNWFYYTLFNFMGGLIVDMPLSLRISRAAHHGGNSIAIDGLLPQGGSVMRFLPSLKDRVMLYIGFRLEFANAVYLSFIGRAPLRFRDDTTPTIHRAYFAGNTSIGVGVGLNIVALLHPPKPLEKKERIASPLVANP
jgi:hypothetical protein